jgi:CBS domain containing-hemolysin-like protein
LAIEAWLWIVIACLTLLCGLNAFASAAASAVRLARRNRLAAIGTASARMAEEILEEDERMCRASRIVGALTRVLAPVLGICAAELVLRRLSVRGGLTEDFSPPPLPAYAAAAVAASVLATLLSELLPRSAAARDPERFLLAIAPAVRLFIRSLAPLDWLVHSVGRRLAPGAGTGAAPRAAHSEEEIRILVEGSAEEGVLEEDERDMIHSIFEFTDTVARKVMVPRIDMKCLQANTPIEEALGVILEEGHSRIPCYEETVDSIVGIVHAKDLLQPLAEGRLSAPLREFMRAPSFVPEGKRLDELLREMRRERQQMAIVVDEYGGTSGLVTLEDILEEIVGEIQDEYDVEEPSLVALDEHTAVVDARMNIDDVNEQLGLDLPTEEFDSVGGFVFGLLGHVPSEGDSVTYDGLAFVVEKVDGNRIEKVRVVRGAAPPRGDGAEEGAPSTRAASDGG